MLRILHRKNQYQTLSFFKKHMLIQNPNMSQKDEEEDHQTHLLKQTRVEIPNMTPNGTIASQKPTGTRKTRDM